MATLSASAMETALDISCEKCGNKYFTEVTAIKKISALVSPTGKEILVPIPVLACADCKHVNDIFLPHNQIK